METLTQLETTLRQLDAAELAWLADHFVRLRNGFAENRPNVAEVCNSIMALLDEERLDRPARADAERAELRKMYTGHEDDDDGEFGWTGDRLKREG